MSFDLNHQLLGYTIQSSDSTKLTLVRESTKGQSRGAIIIGTIAFLTAAALHIFIDSPALPVQFFKALMAVAGVLAMVGGITMERRVQGHQPEKIIFDHALGNVVLMMANGTKAWIPYNEIAGFEWNAFSTAKPTHSSSNRVHNSQTYYEVIMRKKDSGAWHLFYSLNKDEVQHMHARLQAEVPLQALTVVQQPMRVPPVLKLTSTGSKTGFSWRNKPNWPRLLIMAILATMVGSVLWGYTFFATDKILFVTLAVWLLGGFFLALFLTIIWKALRDIFRQYILTVDSNKLEFGTQGTANKKQGKHKVVPLHRIAAITYKFNPRNHMQGSYIEILTLEDAQKEKFRSGTPLAELEPTSIPIEIPALSAVECLQLENALQALISTNNTLSKS